MSKRECGDCDSCDCCEYLPPLMSNETAEDDESETTGVILELVDVMQQFGFRPIFDLDDDAEWRRLYVMFEEFMDRFFVFSESSDETSSSE